MTLSPRRRAAGRRPLTALVDRLACRRCVRFRRRRLATAPTASPSGSRRTCPTAWRPPRRSSTPSPRHRHQGRSWSPSPRTSSTSCSPPTPRPASCPTSMGGIPLGQVRTLSVQRAPRHRRRRRGHRRPRRGHVQPRGARADPRTATPSWRSPASPGPSCSSTARTSSTRPGSTRPRRYDAILAAAKALDSPDVAGFVGANIAGDAFTEQTFEQIGLGNDCQLVDDDGRGHVRQRRVRRGARLLRPR